MYDTCSLGFVRSNVRTRSSNSTRIRISDTNRYDTHIQNSLKEIHDGIGEDDDETTVRTIMICDNLESHDGKRKLYPCFAENPPRLVGFVDGTKYIQKSTAPFKFDSKHESELMTMYHSKNYTLLKREGYKTFQSMLDGVLIQSATPKRPRTGSFVDMESTFGLQGPLEFDFSFGNGSSRSGSTMK